MPKLSKIVKRGVIVAGLLFGGQQVATPGSLSRYLYTAATVGAINEPTLVSKDKYTTLENACAGYVQTIARAMGQDDLMKVKKSLLTTGLSVIADHDSERADRLRRVISEMPNSDGAKIARMSAIIASSTVNGGVRGVRAYRLEAPEIMRDAANHLYDSTQHGNPGVNTM